MHIVDIFENVYILVFVDEMFFKTMKKNSMYFLRDLPVLRYYYWSATLSSSGCCWSPLSITLDGWQGDLWW